MKYVTPPKQPLQTNTQTLIPTGVNLVELNATAMELHNNQQYDAAREKYQAVLAVEPNYFDALHLLGLMEAQAGNVELGLELLAKAEAVNPDVAFLYNNRAGIYKLNGDPAAALEDCDRALKLNPRFTEAQLNRSLILLDLRRLDEALAASEKALKMLNHPSIHNTRGAILKEMDKINEAQASFTAAVKLDKTYPDSYNNRGVILMEMGKTEDAIKDFLTALELNPSHNAARANLAGAYTDAHKFDLAIETYNQVLEANPTDNQVRTHRAMCLLNLGDFENGWAEYEARWYVTEGPMYRSLPEYEQPLWTGEQPLEDRILLLYSEQGHGDGLHFSRYAKYAVEVLGAKKVYLQVDESLVELMESLSPKIEVIPFQQSAVIQFDYHCSLMSMPLACKTSLDNIPYPDKYLKAPTKKVNAWKKKLGTTDKLRVGLCWNGGYRAEPQFQISNNRRNISFGRYKSFADDNVEFYSLQKGEAAEAELAKTLKDKKWKGPRPINFVDEFKSYADTAALIMNLDLVITVDTSVAHLAAAMGKKVWILSRFDGCWRWMLERSDSPWYDSITLYRQTEFGVWDDVIERVAKDLHSLSDNFSK